MRLNSTSEAANLQAMLDPRRIVRWVYLARFSLATAIYAAAVFVWGSAVASDTLIASLAFATTMGATVASAFYSEVKRRPLGRTFFYLQAVLDLLLVTAVVHVTGGGSSQFAALYILVIALAALLLPPRGVTLVALLGCALYFADVFLYHYPERNLGVVLQLVVFGIVAFGSAGIGGRLREAGAGKAQELAAELVQVRLQAADVLENIRSGIVTVDETGHLLYANPVAASILGLPLQDQLGKPVLRRIARLAPDLARAIERTTATRDRVARAEAFVEHPDRTFPIGVSTTWAATADGTAVTAIFQDISDHKRLEALHLRAERLEAVAELSASLAHEIKNPLASIRSAVEQLAGMPTADDDSRTLSGLIVRESDRLSRLLSEFLDFARVRVTQVAPVDVSAIVRGAVDLVGAHPDRRDGVVVRCIVPDEPMMVDGDEDLLHRVVFNLALNAVQATPAGGQVSVEAAQLPVEQLPDASLFEHGAIAVRVSDDGPGISEEIRDRLFAPFTTTKPGGSGLGLSVVHRAVEAHRGLVLVDSAAHGTQFTVLLPRAATGAGVLP